MKTSRIIPYLLLLAACGCTHPLATRSSTGWFSGVKSPTGNQLPLATGQSDAASSLASRYPLKDLSSDQRRSVLNGEWKPASDQNVIQRTASSAKESLSSAVQRAKGAFRKSDVPDYSHPDFDATKLSHTKGAISADVFIASARVFEHQGQTSRALAQYHKALQTDPGNRLATIGYARLQHREGNLDEAISAYRQLLRVNPNDGVGLNDLGLCYARKGMMNEAVAALSRATQVEPTSKLYRNNIATVLIESGDQAQALAHLQQVFSPAESHFNLAALCTKTSPAVAVEHLTKALQYDPQMAPARQMLAQLQSIPGDGMAPTGISQASPIAQLAQSSPRVVPIDNAAASGSVMAVHPVGIPLVNQVQVNRAEVAPSPESWTTTSVAMNRGPEAELAPIATGHSPGGELRMPLALSHGQVDQGQASLPPLPTDVGLSHDGFEYRGVPQYLPPVE